MGTDDKQRKQASSLPGEICLLLAGVQRGPDTRARAHASHTNTRGHADENPPPWATGVTFVVVVATQANLDGVWARNLPERARRESGELSRRRGGRIIYARIRTCPGVRPRRAGVTRVNQRERGMRNGTRWGLVEG